jgi:hypothetical protein
LSDSEGLNRRRQKEVKELGVTSKPSSYLTFNVLFGNDVLSREQFPAVYAIKVQSVACLVGVRKARDVEVISQAHLMSEQMIHQGSHVRVELLVPTSVPADGDPIEAELKQRGTNDQAAKVLDSILRWLQCFKLESLRYVELDEFIIRRPPRSFATDFVRLSQVEDFALSPFPESAFGYSLNRTVKMIDPPEAYEMAVPYWTPPPSPR